MFKKIKAFTVFYRQSVMFLVALNFVEFVVHCKKMFCHHIKAVIRPTFLISRTPMNRVCLGSWTLTVRVMYAGLQSPHCQVVDNQVSAVPHLVGITPPTFSHTSHWQGLKMLNNASFMLVWTCELIVLSNFCRQCSKNEGYEQFCTLLFLAGIFLHVIIVA